MAKTSAIGKEGEHAACDYLISKGYTVRDVNWRMGHLEIDIVAQEPAANCLHIVEVKTRANDEHFDPMQSINRKKINNLVNAANGYIQYYNLPMYVQFDVMILIGQAPDYEILYIPEAFEPSLKTLR